MNKILRMRQWNINPPDGFCLGYSGENDSEVLVIECDILDDTYAYYLEVETEDGGRYIAPLDIDTENASLSITVTNAILGDAGTKQMQIRAVKDETTVKKSNTFVVTCGYSVNAIEDFPSPLPSEFQLFEERIRGYVDDAGESADAAEASKDDAATSAGTAEEKASEASTAAQNAAESAADAEAAKDAAEAARDDAEAAKTDAVAAKTAAEAAASRAETAVENIGDAVQRAETAATNAGNSADDAALSAVAAEDAKDAAVSAEAVVEGYKTAAETAAGQASTAKSAAESAATRSVTAAGNAEASETAAAQSATDAEAAKDAAEAAAAEVIDSNRNKLDKPTDVPQDIPIVNFLISGDSETETKMVSGAVVPPPGETEVGFSPTVVANPDPEAAEEYPYIFQYTERRDVPTGGSTGQLLTKTAAGYGWADAPEGTPAGGTAGQVLTKNSSGDGDCSWADVPKELPSGGEAGQVLTKTADGSEWADFKTSDYIIEDATWNTATHVYFTFKSTSVNVPYIERILNTDTDNSFDVVGTDGETHTVQNFFITSAGGGNINVDLRKMNLWEIYRAPTADDIRCIRSAAQYGSTDPFLLFYKINPTVAESEFSRSMYLGGYPIVSTKNINGITVRSSGGYTAHPYYDSIKFLKITEV